MGQNRYNAAVINIRFVRIVPSIIAQSWLKGSPKAVKNISDLLSCQGITQNVFLNSYSANWWSHKLWNLISISSNGWQREKEGMRKMQEFEYLESRKKLLWTSYKPNKLISSTKSTCNICWMRFVSFLLPYKLPQHHNTVMFKYDICEFLNVHQVITSLASLSDLISL